MRLLITVALAAMAATPSLAQPVYQQMPRPDGTMIDFSVDTPLTEPAGILLLAQGSGCLPTAANGNFATVRKAFPAFIAVMVEKKGVAPDAAIADGFTDCPASFHAGHTVSQRVDDYVAVPDAVRSDVAMPLVLFGGSEGGLAVAMLATRIEADAAVILSSATGIAFADMVLSTVPPEGHDSIRAGFAAAMAAPQSTELFAGSSYRFWADIMDKVPADHMLASDTPFLVIQGGRDTSSPVASARATADRFAAAGRCNLTYWEFPALDHGMADPRGTSRLFAIASAAATWASAARHNDRLGVKSVRESWIDEAGSPHACG